MSVSIDAVIHLTTLKDGSYLTGCCISGQLKTLLDRANPLYDSDYRFRDIYLLLTAAEDEITTPQKAIVTLQGWSDCFEKARLKNVIFAGGVNNPAEIASSPVLKQAEEAGSQL